MGEVVSPSEITKILVMFRDTKGLVVHTFEEDADENGCVSLSFTPTVSGKFRKGRYEYDVGVVTDSLRETVAASLPCVVM